MLRDWSEIRAWRIDLRARLLALRREMSDDERRRINAAVSQRLRDALAPLPGDCIGFYWPIKGEIDLRPAIEGLMQHGATAALPVVAGSGEPLEFRPWHADVTMVRGVWNIPIPATDVRVQPTILLIPLVGFDDQGYRLGYGGGYYDRTLIARSPKPLCIGVGFAAGHLPTIHPQAHDMPMAAILTEQGWHVPLPANDPRVRAAACGDAHDSAREITCASPPCAIGDADPAYTGWIDRHELLALLNQLLEAERAGARGVREIAQASALGSRRDLLAAVANDEAFFCAMLRRHILALGGTPSALTGDFYHKLRAVPEPDAQLVLLNRGQGWVVRQLQRLVPQVKDGALVADLRDMLERHRENIARCDALPPATA